MHLTFSIHGAHARDTAESTQVPRLTRNPPILTCSRFRNRPANDMFFIRGRQQALPALPQNDLQVDPRLTRNRPILTCKQNANSHSFLHSTSRRRFSTSVRCLPLAAHWTYQRDAMQIIFATRQQLLQSRWQLGPSLPYLRCRLAVKKHKKIILISCM